MDNETLIGRLRYDLSELSDVEHLALNYALARLEPERFAQPFLVVWKHHVDTVGETQARQDRNAGLEGLQSRRIISGLKRDGHRDWDMVGGHSKLNLNRLSNPQTLIERPNAGSGVIISDDGE